jgi:hypothetical protein
MAVFEKRCNRSNNAKPLSAESTPKGRNSRDTARRSGKALFATGRRSEKTHCSAEKRERGGVGRVSRTGARRGKT